MLFTYFIISLVSLYFLVSLTRASTVAGLAGAIASNPIDVAKVVLLMTDIMSTS